MLALAGTVSVWIEYLNARSDRFAEAQHHAEQNMAMLDNPSQEETEIIRPEEQLTNNFWQWEAQGRLGMIDVLLDHPDMVAARKMWGKDDLVWDDLLSKVKTLIDIQNKAYGVDKRFHQVAVQNMPLRGDANGLYVPQSKTIYLNTRMDWDRLSFERFVEVVLHENMHHIMTHMGATLHQKDDLYGDFASLTRAAYFHDTSGMAQDQNDLYQANLQELVAWRTQRAARYAGIIGSDLTVWDMSARTQEIRNISKQAGF